MLGNLQRMAFQNRKANPRLSTLAPEEDMNWGTKHSHVGGSRDAGHLEWKAGGPIRYPPHGSCGLTSPIMSG